MKTKVTLCSLLLLAAISSVALAGAPLAGIYRTTDLGGAVSTGHYTEGWSGGGGAMLAGTTLTAESWNGAVLGTEWRYSCATEAAPAVITSDNVDVYGDGNRTYKKTFVGGTIWLSGTGPWAGGDASYPGVIDSYIEYETIQYYGGVPVAAITNVQANAHFDAYPATCMTFYVSNGTKVGSTDDAMTRPASYPAFLEAGTCAPTAPYGAWWDMSSMTLTVSRGCATPAQTTTWGTLKTRYR
jgi:hypothetical protein